VVIRDAYQTGMLGFSMKDPTSIWKGPAARMDRGEDGWKKAASGQLEISEIELRFGGLIKKSTILLEQIDRVSANGNRINLLLKEETEPLTFELEPVELTVQLESGNRSIRVDAADLLARLRYELAKEKTEEAQTVAR